MAPADRAQQFRSQLRQACRTSGVSRRRDARCGPERMSPRRTQDSGPHGPGSDIAGAFFAGKPKGATAACSSGSHEGQRPPSGAGAFVGQTRSSPVPTRLRCVADAKALLPPSRSLASTPRLRIGRLRWRRRGWRLVSAWVGAEQQAFGGAGGAKPSVCTRRRGARGSLGSTVVQRRTSWNL